MDEQYGRDESLEHVLGSVFELLLTQLNSQEAQTGRSQLLALRHLRGHGNEKNADRVRLVRAIRKRDAKVVLRVMAIR